MINDKKGQVFSYLPYILFGVVVSFIFAVVVLVVSHGGDEIFDELKRPENLGESNITVDNINQVQNLMTPAFDQLVFIVLISIILGALVIAIFTDYHPVVLGLFIIAITLLVIISGLFVDVFDDIRSTPELEEKSEEFTLTNLMFGRTLPIMFTIVGIVGVIILLAKRGRVVGA